jgi:hypothetical protein
MALFEWLPHVAAKHRSSPRLTKAAHIVAGILFALALMDVFSTNLGLANGAFETNHLIGWLQDTFGMWWFVPKLIIHLIPVAMILWYPHRWVLMIVSPVIPYTAFIVWNNLHIAWN